MPKIEQVDREAAAYCYLALEGPPYSPKDLAEAEAHQRGDYDAHEAVKAFAAHRIAAERACAAKLAEAVGEVAALKAENAKLREHLLAMVGVCDGGGETGFRVIYPPTERVLSMARAAIETAQDDDNKAGGLWYRRRHKAQTALAKIQNALGKAGPIHSGPVPGELGRKYPNARQVVIEFEEGEHAMALWSALTDASAALGDAS